MRYQADRQRGFTKGNVEGTRRDITERVNEPNSFFGADIEGRTSASKKPF